MSTSYKQQHFKSLDLSLLIGCFFVFGITILYPSARLVWSALQQWQSDIVLSGSGREAILNTLVMCFLSVLTSGILGTALAFFVTKYTFPGKTSLAALAYLPFALPPLVGTLGFYYLIGSDYVVPRTIRLIPGLEDFSFTGPAAILIIHTYSFMVYFYAMVSAALEGMDASQVEAARSLGASPWLAFRKVTVPALRPALLGASLLAFMTSGASFSAPLFFGGDFSYLSVQIFNERSQFNEGGALTLSVVLACVSLLGVVIFRSGKVSEGAATKGTPREITSTSGRMLTGAIAWLCMLLLLLPHLNILLMSFTDHQKWHAEILPHVFTLENYKVLFQDPAAFRPIRNSLWMSAVAATAILLAGLPASYLIGRGRIGGRWLNVLVMIPWALPGTVVGMNLIASFNDDWLPIYNTIWLLPIAYFIRFLPLLTRMTTAAVSQFDATLIEAGQTLGASPWYCFKRVVIPLMAPSLAAATALVFASCLGEFVATILLYTPANLPIAIQINQEWRGSGVGSAFAYSVFLMLMVVITFLISRRFGSRAI